MPRDKTSQADVAAIGARYEQLRVGWFSQTGSKKRAAEARKAASMWEKRHQAAIDFHAKEAG